VKKTTAEVVAIPLEWSARPQPSTMLAAILGGSSMKARVPAPANRARPRAASGAPGGKRPSTDHGNDMYLDAPVFLSEPKEIPVPRPPVARPGRGPLPYREAMELTGRRLHEQYSRDCAGVQVLQWLRRPPLTLAEEVRFWERVIDWLPKLFALKQELDQRVRAGRMSHEDARVQMRFQMRKVFPPGYALGTEPDELARARCALSKARWQLVARQQHGQTPLERRLEGLGQAPVVDPVNPTSAHHHVDRDGDITQKVREANVAFHVGRHDPDTRTLHALH
jgi:hypothetical protein